MRTAKTLDASLRWVHRHFVGFVMLGFKYFETFQCPDEKKDASKRSNEEDDEEKKQSMITQKYQMMDLAVQPNTSLPLMHQMNER